MGIQYGRKVEAWKLWSASYDEDRLPTPDVRHDVLTAEPRDTLFAKSSHLQPGSTFPKTDPFLGGGSAKIEAKFRWLDCLLSVSACFSERTTVGEVELVGKVWSHLQFPYLLLLGVG